MNLSPTSQDTTTSQASASLEAGRKACLAKDWPQAAKILTAGLAALPTDCWQRMYPITLELHLLGCEAAFRNGQLTKLAHLFSAICRNASSNTDICRAYRIKITALKAANQANQAIDLGLEILRLLGLNLPKNPSRLRIALAHLQTRLQLTWFKPYDIVKLPEMEDETAKALSGLLLDISTLVYSHAPALTPLLCLKAVSISLQYGSNRDTATMAFPLYGSFLCSLPGDHIFSGYSYSQLGIELQKSHANAKIHPLSLYLISNFITHWKHHGKDSLPSLKTAVSKSKEHDNVEIAALAASSYIYHLYHLGTNLQQVETQMAVFQEHVERMGESGPRYRQALYHQAVDNLLGGSDNPIHLRGKFYDVELMLPIHLKAGDQTTVFHTLLLQLIHAFIFNSIVTAERCAKEAEKHLPAVSASFVVPLYFFYDALTHLARYPNQKGLEKRRSRVRIGQHLRQMKIWARHSPMNYQHKYLLIQAEIARTRGQVEQAMDCYDQAIALAHTHGYLQEEALAYELAARFYLGQGRAHIARFYMREAQYCYYRWGATAKTRQFENPDGLGSTSTTVATSPSRPLLDKASPGTMPGVAESGSRLDMMTVIKASRIMTSETASGELMQKALQILMESASAQRGFLIFPTGGQGWRIAVHGSIYKDAIVSLTNLAVSDQQIASAMIIHHVANTGQDVVLSDASREGAFVRDPYVISKRPRSLLCIPVRQQERLFCILYLENNLASGSFSPDRRELISLLANQAAISLRNAGLIEELENTVNTLNTEVSRRQEAQNQLLHSEKLSALGRLSASIAHEFGNPLLGVKYLLDDFHKRPTLSDSDRELLKLGREECERMKELIKNLQQLHRPTSSQKSLTNLNLLIENVLLFQKKHFAGHRIRVTKDFDADIPFISVVEDQLYQVLLNLTMNAVDAMREGGGQLTVVTRKVKGGITIAVSDSGIGIAIESQERVFEPFFSTKHEEDGTGLGLSISYGIIQHHGGTINFHSQPGQGTTFTIFLPQYPERLA